METVYKYALAVTDEQELWLPVHAQPLYAAIQDDILCVWCRVDPNSEADRPITFRVAGTGHTREKLGTYLSTFMMHNGALVFHVFYD